jgi:hypothetical protein
MRAHTSFRARGAHPASAWSAGGWPAQTHKWSCLPPSPVSCPGATRCCTALLCYACCAPMRPAVHRGPAASFPAPVVSMQERCKERSMCRWRPRTCAISLAARMSSCLCRRNSTRTVTLLAVHAADTVRRGSFCPTTRCMISGQCSVGIPYVGCFGPGRRLPTIGGGLTSCASS